VLFNGYGVQGVIIVVAAVFTSCDLHLTLTRTFKAMEVMVDVVDMRRDRGHLELRKLRMAVGNVASVMVSYTAFEFLIADLETFYTAPGWSKFFEVMIIAVSPICCVIVLWSALA